MNITEFARSRNVEAQAVSRYISRHKEEFEGLTEKNGKTVNLRPEAIARLERVYSQGRAASGASLPDQNADRHQEDNTIFSVGFEDPKPEETVFHEGIRNIAREKALAAAKEAAVSEKRAQEISAQDKPVQAKPVQESPVPVKSEPDKEKALFSENKTQKTENIHFESGTDSRFDANEKDLEQKLLSAQETIIRLQEKISEQITAVERAKLLNYKLQKKEEEIDLLNKKINALRNKIGRLDEEVSYFRSKYDNRELQVVQFLEN